MRTGRATALAVAAIATLSLSIGIALAAGVGKLSFVGALAEGQFGVSGIQGPDDVAVSGDGDNVYVAGGSSDAIATFKRNATTGHLSFVNAKTTGQGGVTDMHGPIDVAVSADGRSVYVTSSTDGSIVTFKRNRDTGKLTFLNAKLDGQGGITGLDEAYGVVVSRDNKNVYVSNDTDPGAVVTFKRNRDTGKLTFVNTKVGGVGGVEGITDTEGIAIAPDGKAVYVTGSSDNAVATFARNRRTGKLKFVNAKFDGQGGVTGLQEAYEPVVSPDNRNVYVTAGGNPTAAIATFKRNRDTGKLKFVNAKLDNPPDLPLNDAYDVVVSRDNRDVYVAFYDNGTNSGLDTFKRNRDTGKLTFVNAKRDEMGGITGVTGLWRVAISPDDKHLYTANYDGDSVGIFKRAR